MILTWLRGQMRVRLGRMLGTILGVVVVVALLVDLGAFLNQSSTSMTARALRTVTTDWQVELVPTADVATITADVRSTAPIVSIQTVGYAAVEAFEFKNSDGVQTTGIGKAVGLPSGYFDKRQSDVRILSGDLSGGVLLQQTAANLHAQPGDTILLRRSGQPDAPVMVSGIVDLRSADAFFQAVGVPPGAAPTAPPDNAILLPADQWTALFGPQAGAHPATVRTQLHVTLDRTRLPTDPNDAYALAASLGRNLEARVAGSATLANNLAAQLDAARGDALYAKVLFLFLGSPGVVLAALLTFVIALSGRRTRLRDQALLKLRGASSAVSLGFLAAEAAAVGITGAILGLGLAAAVGTGLGGLAITVSFLPFVVAGLIAGVGLSALAILGPSIIWSRSQTVAASRGEGLRDRSPLWQRLYIDALCLVLAGIVFWQTAATGYQVVLATEGVTATSVDYTAFLAPILFWIGASLGTLRLTRLLLIRGKPAISAITTPFAGPLAPAVAAALAWQSRRVAIGVALTALAVGFLVSTAIFNATYEAQSRVDAELTNGADVSLTGSTTSPAGVFLERVRKLPSVQGADAMQHRYAYVGTDLQDLYGIDAQTIGGATNMSNAFFQNGNAAATLALLAQTPNAILVSDETVSDFQLTLGDAINLRLQGADGTYQVVPFVFSGVVREFPTAPRDSFLVANASYVQKATGVASREIVLARTADPTALKKEAAALVTGQPIQVSSLLDVVHIIGSSLTAVDLNGLSRIELTFAILLGVGATALVLALGFADRRRDFAILKAIGAKNGGLAAFVWGETGLILLIGLVSGAVIGVIVSEVLIVVLRGVFDPPPEAPSVPWWYLAVAALVLIVAVSGAAFNATTRAGASPIARLREQQ